MGFDDPPPDAIEPNQMNRFLFHSWLVVGACSIAPQAQDAPDGEVVSRAVRTVQPGPILALPDLIEDILDADDACPVLAVMEHGDDGLGTTRELWTGGCQLSDGTVVDGVLEWVAQPDGLWIAGEGFSITRDGTQELYVDGTLEIIEQQDLLLVDADATWCGHSAFPCDGDPLTVDLRYSIYPAHQYPEIYDVTVSGVVAPGAPIAVEGSWRVDQRICATEPMDGVFALDDGQRHDLTLDGAVACDACAEWVVQGRAVSPFCDVAL